MLTFVSTVCLPLSVLSLSSSVLCFPSLVICVNSVLCAYLSVSTVFTFVSTVCLPVFENVFTLVNTMFTFSVLRNAQAHVQYIKVFENVYVFLS